MPEAILPALLALLLLAGGSHRFRRDSGLMTPRAIRAARGVALLLLLLAWWTCGAGLAGERVVRFVVCLSIAAVPLVLLLSIASGAIFTPLRLALARRPR